MKKASIEIGTEVMDWIFNLFVIFVVIGVIIFTVWFNASRKIDVNGAEVDTIKTFLIYSPACFSYSDERSYPGIIDLEKFNNVNCFQKETLGINLTLNDLDGNFINSKFINEPLFKDMKPFCGLKVKTFDCFKKSEYILIKSGNEIKKGVLSFDIIVNHG